MIPGPFATPVIFPKSIRVHNTIRICWSNIKFSITTSNEVYYTFSILFIIIAVFLTAPVLIVLIVNVHVIVVLHSLQFPFLSLLLAPSPISHLFHLKFSSRCCPERFNYGLFDSILPHHGMFHIESLPMSCQSSIH